MGEWKSEGKGVYQDTQIRYCRFQNRTDRINWHEFSVGRQFTIAFKYKTNRELKIQFRSYFGRFRDSQQKYADIVQDIWSLYHSDIVERFLDNFYNLGQVEIHGIQLTSVGVQLSGGRSIPWDRVATRNYETYFAVYDLENANVHVMVNYYEYGSETLWSAVTTILKEKGRSA